MILPFFDFCEQLRPLIKTNFPDEANGISFFHFSYSKYLLWSSRSVEDFANSYFWGWKIADGCRAELKPEKPKMQAEKQTPALTKKELELAAYWLREAADVLGDRICNDVDDSIWQEWSIEERRKFVKECHEWNGDPQEYDPNFLSMFDWEICDFLAHKLKQQAK